MKTINRFSVKGCVCVLSVRLTQAPAYSLRISLSNTILKVKASNLSDIIADFLIACREGHYANVFNASRQRAICERLQAL